MYTFLLRIIFPIHNLAYRRNGNNVIIPIRLRDHGNICINHENRESKCLFYRYIILNTMHGTIGLEFGFIFFCPIKFWSFWVLYFSSKNVLFNNKVLMKNELFNNEALIKKKHFYNEILSYKLSLTFLSIYIIYWLLNLCF